MTLKVCECLVWALRTRVNIRIKFAPVDGVRHRRRFESAALVPVERVLLHRNAMRCCLSGRSLILRLVLIIVFPEIIAQLRNVRISLDVLLPHLVTFWLIIVYNSLTAIDDEITINAAMECDFFLLSRGKILWVHNCILFVKDFLLAQDN